MKRVTEREVEQALAALRPLSDSARELLRLTADDDHAVADVVGVIARDAALTLRIVELSNSAAFAPRMPVESVVRAVAIMGERAVVAAALEIGAEWIHAPLAGYGPEVRLFEDGIRAATVASSIAKRASHPELAAVAYTGALLRDIGKIVSSGLLAPRRSGALAALAAAEQSDWLGVERGVIGLDHCALGARVATRFKLPASLRAAIEFHHAPRDAEPAHRPLVAIIHLADAAVGMLGGTEAIDAFGYRFDPGVLDLLGLGEDAFETLLSESDAEATSLLAAVGHGPATDAESDVEADVA